MRDKSNVGWLTKLFLLNQNLLIKNKVVGGR